MDNQEPTDSSQNTKPSIISEVLISEGKWARLGNRTYMDPMGKKRTWETVTGTTGKGQSTDGVASVPVLQRALHWECVFGVQQC